MDTPLNTPTSTTGPDDIITTIDAACISQDSPTQEEEDEELRSTIDTDSINTVDSNTDDDAHISTNDDAHISTNDDAHINTPSDAHIKNIDLNHNVSCVSSGADGAGDGAGDSSLIWDDSIVEDSPKTR